ncbi:MAG: Hpt domain-containing protein [Leptolyngbyaceae cyanobacterium bins.302]|nr:Hpt domain-containing protein [Leptolyngbyaceae cyanobacterium bins.302]
MQATKQQQIMGFFIEEAKEHLDTIEQGLLDLQATMSDSEQLNELFRAAHSIKGGAAMLGFDSIQRVGHHLEDYFKVLKENPLKPDRHLEDLFLKGFDVLKELVEALQSPYGLQESQGEQIVQASQPIFLELQNYLNQLMKAGSGTASQPSVKTSPDAAALIPVALKKMLQLFKQGDSVTCRQQLATLCSRMAQLTTSSEWRGLLRLAQEAVSNSKHSYQVLAPLLIKELKLAGDLLVVGRSHEIVPSRALQQLVEPATPPNTPAPPPITPPIAAKPTPAVEPVPSARMQQVMVPLEPRAAARALLDAFNKKQLIELAEFLMKAIQ